MRLFTAVVLALLPTSALAYSDTSMINSRSEALAYIDKQQDVSMPDGFSLRLGFCDTDECVYDKAATLLAMQGAYKKDYGDQRNLAYCLSDGCKGAIIPNETLALQLRF